MDNMFHFWLRLQRMTQQFVFFVFCFATLLRFEIFETGQKRVKVKHRQILFLERGFSESKKTFHSNLCNLGPDLWMPWAIQFFLFEFNRIQTFFVVLSSCLHR